MSRKEAIFLVSRALALLLGFWASVDVLYLPEKLFSAYRYVHLQSVMDRSVLDTSTYYAVQYGLLSPLTLIVQILLYALAAALFWNCGPWVSRLFEPPPN